MNKTMTIIWSAILLAFPPIVAAQKTEDVLYLQGGRERVGRLVHIDNDRVSFLIEGEQDATAFFLADVQRIDLAGEREGDEIARLEDLHDPLLQRLVKGAPAKFFHPDSGYITLYHLMEKRLNEDGSYTVTERSVNKVLLERGKSLANVARYFKKGEENLKVDFARTINPDGTVTPITESAVDVTSVNSDTPEYDRQQQLKFSMKKVAENSILDYQLTFHRRQTDLLHPFMAVLYFRAMEPMLEAELRIIVPKGRKLAFVKQHAYHVVKSVEEVGDDTVYTFTGKNCPRVIPEPYMPPWPDCVSRVVAAEATTWDAIGDAYRRALLAASHPTPAITRKVGELTAGTSDVDHKARAIYRYFAEEIRQIWVGPEAYSYSPRPVGEVFEQHAGNTTDKAALLRAMLLEAGVPADIVLACPQSSGKLVEEVPAIKQLDDALVLVHLPTGQAFLAVDNDTARFGQIPGEYQGTRGMLVTATGSRLIDIPLNDADEESVAYTYDMMVSANGDLVVTETEKPRGNYEMGYRAAWKNMKEDEIRRQLEVALTDLNGTARLDHYAIENLHDLDQPLTFRETYTLEDYAFGDDALLVFRLPEIDYSAGSVGLPTRKFRLKWQHLSKSTNDVVVHLPEGFRVYHAGRDFQAESPPATFFARYTVEAGTVRYHDEYVHREVEARIKSYQAYKDCVETMARVPKEWIVLERSGPDPAP